MSRNCISHSFPMAHVWLHRPDIQRILSVPTIAKNARGRLNFCRVTGLGSSTVHFDLLDFPRIHASLL